MTEPDPHRLHPEGAPGLVGVIGRAFMGDSAYEAQQAQAAVDAAVAAVDHADRRARYRAITGAMTIALIYAMFILTAVTVATWRWALS